MPYLPSGLYYEQLYELNGQRAYNEAFSRDSNIFTAILAVNWLDVQSFRTEMMGQTQYTSGQQYRFVRSVPQICPYTERARCLQMEMMGYGRSPRAADIQEFDDLVATNAPLVPPEKVSYVIDPESEDWFVTHWAYYKCTFQRLPYTILTDSEVDTMAGATTYGKELYRYVVRQTNNNVRELRLADYGFELYPVTTPSTVLPINSFIVTVESEVIYTWYQVPFDNVPRTYMQSLKGKINSTVFDPVRQYPAETMLYVDTKQIDVPYEGPDGGLYCDPQVIFRRKQNIGADGTTIVGHQHVYDSSTSSSTAGKWVKVQRRNVGGFIYETSADFGRLFSPGT